MQKADTTSAITNMTMQRDSRRKIFEGIYRHRKWGKEGGGSGPGSDLRFARGASDIVSKVISLLAIHSMIDAPCGAREWQTPMVHELQTKDPEFRYLGLDIASKAIEQNRDPKLPTQLHDLVGDPMPLGYDMVLSRDALQHNTEADIFKILKRFACSDARFFLLGSYPQSKDFNKKIRTGDYFEVDLQKEPYSLKPWMIFNEHHGGKHLYLYNTSQVAHFAKSCTD